MYSVTVEKLPEQIFATPVTCEGINTKYSKNISIKLPFAKIKCLGSPHWVPCKIKF